MSIYFSLFLCSWREKRERRVFIVRSSESDNGATIKKYFASTHSRSPLALLCEHCSGCTLFTFSCRYFTQEDCQHLCCVHIENIKKFLHKPTNIESENCAEKALEENCIASTFDFTSCWLVLLCRRCSSPFSSLHHSSLSRHSSYAGINQSDVSAWRSL
jgi:hypothetical protein